MGIDTVIFDMDGVILDSEVVWDDVRHDFALAHGGHWGHGDQTAVMGANSLQWAAHMRLVNGVHLSDREILDGIIKELKVRFREHLPLIPGAADAITDLAAAYRLGVASSSPRELIEYALESAGLRLCFSAVVSSDDVGRGKPEPDVYLEACAQLGTVPSRAVAVEDSAVGIRSARAAGLLVVAVPSPAFPPTPETVAQANVVLGDIGELDRTVIAALEARGDGGGRW